MEVVRLMALLFAHITFQIRRGFRSRIFFELKILFLPDYAAQRRNPLIPTQSEAKFWHHRPSPLFPLPREEDSVFEYVSRIDSDPATSIGCEAKSFPAWAGIKGWVKGAKIQAVFSNQDSDQKTNFTKPELHLIHVIKRKKKSHTCTL